jgi:cell division protein FtsL
MNDRQEVSKEFPHNMSDEQIGEAIKLYMDKIIQSGSQENIVIQCYPLVALGQHELEKRQTNRLTRFTSWISYVSIFIAIVALAISIINTRSSSRWEQRQIESLATLQTKIDAMNANIHDLVLASQKSAPPSRVEPPSSKQK